MAILGSLTAHLSMDSSNFQKGAKKAQDTTSTMQKAMRGLKIGAIGAGVAVAGAFGGGLFAGKQAAEDIDKMSKLSRQLGLSTQTLGVLKLAAERGGSSIEAVGKATVALSRRANLFVQTGKGPLANTLKDWGVSQAELTPLIGDSTRLLGFFADKLAQLPSGAKRLDAATRIFSMGAGRGMLNVLEGGSAGLQQTAEDAELFGLTLSTSAGKNIESFNDNMDTAGAAIKGLRNSIVSGLSPAMKVVSEMFADWIRGLAEARGGFTELGSAIAGKIIGGLKSLTLGLAASLNKLNLLKETIANPIDASRGNLIVKDIINVQSIDETFTRIQRGIDKVKKQSQKADLSTLGAGISKDGAKAAGLTREQMQVASATSGRGKNKANFSTIFDKDQFLMNVFTDKSIRAAKREGMSDKDLAFEGAHSMSQAMGMAEAIMKKRGNASAFEQRLLPRLLRAIELLVENTKTGKKVAVAG